MVNFNVAGAVGRNALMYCNMLSSVSKVLLKPCLIYAPSQRNVDSCPGFTTAYIKLNMERTILSEDVAPSVLNYSPWRVADGN